MERDLTRFHGVGVGLNLQVVREGSGKTREQMTWAVSIEMFSFLEL